MGRCGRSTTTPHYVSYQLLRWWRQNYQIPWCLTPSLTFQDPSSRTSIGMWDIVADAMQLAVSLAELTFYVEYVERRKEGKEVEPDVYCYFFFWCELDCATVE